jgi:protein-S-isoprenylcysteine O-methyltransferase Ste14
MLFLKLYLLFGLVFHKVIWEVLRKKADEKPKEKRSPGLLAVKAVKVGILLGIIAQTLLPFDVLPIAENSFGLRLAGTIIYTAGLLTAIAARFQLGDNWANIETGQILESQQVVARGIYGLIRHPIYTGDLLLLLGLELALNSWLVLGVFVLAPVVLLKAVKEEKMLVRELAGYEAYCARTKRFIPFVI